METPYKKEENEQAWTAWQCLMRTGVNIFLTGEAGTGKTTFLRHLRDSHLKNMVVTAPTGVAAINAGGVTLHSFFQLPIGTFAPGELPEAEKNKIRKERQKVIRTMDLLVIDEVSMVRADLLDLVDARLREQRRNNLPFGGVQLLLIGDLMQLAPVVRPEDQEILSQYYPNCYFFSSKALARTQFYTISLKKIYRQSDNKFIDLLNHVRTASMTAQDLALLNQRYDPNFKPGKDDGYIRMTTHVQTAEDINEQNLAKLKGKAVTYASTVEGEFPANSYPATSTLTLKIGAQVMFIRNGSVGDVEYYNGMMARVIDLEDERVTVEIEGGDRVDVGPARWGNIRYEVDEQTGETVQREIGAFSQIPLALAWAITIHKSQGLTFDKAIIDASRAFSPGQVYVALSRCRTFEGLVLNTPIPSSAIRTDYAIRSFFAESDRNRITSEAIETFANDFSMNMMKELFSFDDVFASIRLIYNILQRNYGGRYPKCEAGLFQILTEDDKASASSTSGVGLRFIAKCQARHAETGSITSDDALMDQAQRGAKYFVEKLTQIRQKVDDVANISPDDEAGRKRLTNIRAQLKTDMNIHLAELQAVATDGFSTATIMKAKAKALSQEDDADDDKKSSFRASEANEVVNKSLFFALRDWRRQKAELCDKPAYIIAPNKTLVDIADMVPTSVKELSKASGMGKDKLKAYADEILNIVSQYRKKGVRAVRTESSSPSKNKAPKEPKPDTRKVSLDAFRRLGSVDAVAKERGFTKETITKHLISFIGKGLTIEKIMGAKRHETLKKLIEDGHATDKIWKDFLNSEYHYVRKELGLE